MHPTICRPSTAIASNLEQVVLNLVRNAIEAIAGAGQTDGYIRVAAIGVRTVESYRAEIMEKMRAESVAVLVRQAIRLGRITP
jgi:nitrogen-specific signal transduction histidine kinase